MNDRGENTWGRSGLTLLGGGLLLLTSFGVWEAVRDGGTPSIVRVGVIATVVGLGILLVRVLVQRLREGKDDPYKDVEI